METVHFSVHPIPLLHYVWKGAQHSWCWYNILDKCSQYKKKTTKKSHQGTMKHKGSHRQLLFPPSFLNCCLQKSTSTHIGTSYTFSVPSPFPLLEYHSQLSIIQPANTLIFPSNTHNITTSAAKVKQYYTTKTKFLPLPTASLFPTHRFYPTLKLDDGRAQISYGRARGAHHKHPDRSTASSRAAWPQVSIIITPSLRAPGNQKNNQKNNQQKTGRWIYCLSSTIYLLLAA